MKCQKCQLQYNDVETHIKQCMFLKLSLQGAKKTKNSINLYNDITACLICNEIFQKKLQYTKHSKNCRRTVSQTSKSSSKKAIYPPTLKKMVHLDDGQRKTSEQYDLAYLDHNLPSLMTQYYRISSIPALIQWKDSHKGIRNDILFEIYKRHTQNSIRSFIKSIPQLSLGDLIRKFPKIHWNNIFKDTNQLFDKKIIEKALDKFSVNKRNKLKKMLNLYFKQYPNIFDKLKLQPDINAIKRTKAVLLPDQLLKIVSSLIYTNKRNYIHIGIDLMIMFQCGQRFPSAISNDKFIQKINQQLNTDCTTMEFIFRSKKTGKEMIVLLDQQLVFMMRKIKWSKFYSLSLYQRLSKVFPFSCFAIRRGYFTLIVFINNNGNIHKITQHKSLKNAQIYVSKLLSKTLKENKALLRIQNIIGYTGIIQNPPTIDIQSQIPLKDAWFQDILIKLQQKGIKGGQKYEFVLINHQKSVNVQVQNNNENFEVQQPQQVQSIQRSSSESSQSSQQQNQRQLYICQVSYQYGGYLSPQSLYSSCQTETCSYCQSKSVVVCKQCADFYCKTCKKKFCKCKVFNTFDEPMEEIKSWKVDSIQTEINLPKKYTMGKYEQNFDEIKTLIYARNYHFSNVAISDYQSSVKIPGITRFQLDNFRKYVKGQYFPPLKLKIFGQQSADGPGFGLFAAQDIDKNVFIGQYAASFMLRLRQKFVKRKDMIFMVQKDKIPSKSVILAPLTYTGYITLINQSQNPNCTATTVIIDNRVRVIVFSHKKIQKNKQLFIDYDWETDQGQKPTWDSGHFHIRPQENNCYFAVVMQLLYNLPQYFKCRSQDQILSLINRIYSSKSEYSGSKILKSIFNSFNGLKYGEQNDAQQLLSYVLSIYIQNQLSQKFEIKIQYLDMCSQCRYQKTSGSVESMLSIDVNSNYQQLFSKQQAIQILCEKCNKNTSFQRKTMIQSNDLIILHFKRFDKDQKLKKQITIQKKLDLNNTRYTKKFVISHIGNSMKSGHYIISDASKQITFDGQHIYEREQQKEKENCYIVVFQKQQADKGTIQINSNDKPLE